ncbi:hypothetical protein [Mycobacterium tilburgii]|uniref:hypothetical protein n=1 Tax=Mycobacterium tilburgii TaxID=44467 RepID=UPI0021B3715A
MGDYCGSQTAMMPRRKRTRAQDRVARIATERRRNRDARTARRETLSGAEPAVVAGDPDPPPSEPARLARSSA